MALARIVLLTILALIGSAVAGYILVALAFFGSWALMGIHDRDGGGAMAVGFVFAPIGAVIFGLIGAILAFTMLRRRRLAAPAAPAEAAIAESALLLSLGAAMVGLLLGWQASDWLRYALHSLSRDNLIFAVLFAISRWVLPLAFALAGFFLIRARATKRKPQA